MPMQPTTIPAPTGGLNAVDNLASMPATDALRMINIIPTPYGCTVRKGYKRHQAAALFDGPVSSMFTHALDDGSIRIYAFTDHDVYGIEAMGAAGAWGLSLSPAPWEGLNFANSAGVHFVAFNGADDGIWVEPDGNVERLTAGDGTTKGTWSGVNPDKLVAPVTHQRRLWAIEANTTRGWYLPADSIYGVANYFDFGPHFKRGGALAKLAAWSSDMGVGSDDQLVAISTEGDVAVFGGTDVSDSTKWELRGVYYIGRPPAGRRFTTNIGGDLYVVTSAGIVSMASVLTSTKVNITSDTTFSRKIQYMLNGLFQGLEQLPGWELQYYPEQNLLYLNIPGVYEAGSGQLVCSYVNGSWCTFSGMDARAWVQAKGRLYFAGRSGGVYEAGTGDTDDASYVGTGGRNVISVCQQAYTSFGSLTNHKQIGMYRPIFLAGQPPGIDSNISYDYRDARTLSATAAVPSLAGSPVWDTSYWDTASWGTQQNLYRGWIGAEGMGLVASLSLALSTGAETTWVGTDFTFNSGGVL